MTVPYLVKDNPLFRVRPDRFIKSDVQDARPPISYAGEKNTCCILWQGGYMVCESVDSDLIYSGKT